MTNSKMEALARQLVVSKQFRWLPGMLTVLGPRYTDDGGIQQYDENEYAWRDCPLPDGSIPDLSDPATLGCLLQLVREAWGDPHAHVEPDEDGEWCCWLPGSGSAGGHRGTEAEALVAALLAAPEAA